MFKVWNKHALRWEAVSERAAARRRARGDRVIERRDPDQPPLVEVELLDEDPDAGKAPPAPPAPPVAAPSAPDDLTDEELERLTAPGAEE